MLRALAVDHDVMLLQECGRLAEETSFGKKLRVYSDLHGAGNVRCSTAILCKDYDDSGFSQFTSTWRAGIWVRIGNLYLGTIHCTANGKPKDRNDLAMELYQRADGAALIIGGDFNTEPGSSATLNVGISAQGAQFQVIAPGRGTQQSGKVLDYFLIANGVKCLEFHSLHTDRSPSDHGYVSAIFEYAM